MSRKRGRPGRPYRLRVRTERRDPIDADALARAALEHAAMQQSDITTMTPPPQNPHRRQKGTHHSKDHRHDRLA